MSNELNIDINRIESDLSLRLSNKRYNHCLRVAQLAKRIASKTEVDTEKMYIAGLLHDVAKELSNDEILRLCDLTGTYIPRSGKENPHSLHGIAGAAIAYGEYEIRDKDILLSIAFHSGRAAMSDAEKIVFLADFLDNSAKYGIDWTPVWKQKNLNSAMLVMCSLMTNYCIEHNVQMDDRTQDSFDFILEEICENRIKDEAAIKKIRSEVDEIIDGAMDCYISHRLKLKSVKNIRDFGGFVTLLGVPIKKGKIIRSGCLNKLTKEDADTLKQIGINTIIDLRTKEEIKSEPDINIEGFRYNNFPIASINIDTNQERFLDYMNGSVDEEESAYYAAEYLRYVDMEEMYRNIWQDKESAKQIANVFKTLIDPNTTGVLIHCTSGKDRTGVLSLQIQYCLGCSDTDVINDYYASSLPYYMLSESLAIDLEKSGYSVELSNRARQLLGIGSDMMKRVSEWWQEKYTNGVDYMKKELHLTYDDIAALQAKYLETSVTKIPIELQELSQVREKGTVLSVNDDNTYIVQVNDNHQIKALLSPRLKLEHLVIHEGSIVEVQLSINLQSGRIIKVIENS